MRSVVIGTAGHIDHGKSALVRALSGTDPDRLKEEKARGITIDLGFAHLETGGVRLAFVDVPGHERFVKNMLAGAGGIDLVMLVIAGDESVMPQTREHFQICRLLQVPAGIVVITKSDIADPEMIELARLEARELTAGSFLDGAPIVAVSATTGAGLDELRHALTAAAGTLRLRDEHGPARLPIDRVFSVRGFGTVVTGTLVSGELRQEQGLEVLPRELEVKVRGLQVHGRGEAVATAGRRVAVNLGGIDVPDLARGDTLSSPGAFEPTRRFDAVVETLADARPLRHGTRVRFHQGTNELLGRIAIAGIRGGEAGAAEIPAGRSAYVRFRLEGPAVLTRGDRFIVRAYSPPATIGGGVVLDPQPLRAGIRSAAALERYRRLDMAEVSRGAEAPRYVSDSRALSAFIDERGGAGLSTAAMTSRAGLSATDAERISKRMVAAGEAIMVGDLLVPPAALAHLAARLLAALKAHHTAQPLSDGLPREEARERIFGGAAPVVFDHVLAALVAEGKIVARELLALAGHRLALSPQEARAQATIERLVHDGGLAPPEVSSIAAADVPPDVVERVAKLLVRQKTLVKVDTLLFHADVLARLKAEVRELKMGQGQARVDVAGFKERYGISRKYAIPLLEYLDRERVTKRVGDARVVL